MRPNSPFAAFAVFSALVAALPALADGGKAVEHLFASEHGSGNVCSDLHPCSLVTAKLAAHRYALQHREVVVSLAAGHYRLSSPIVFQATDSGTKDAPIVWSGNEQAETVLDGGVRVVGWSLADAKKNIWKATLPANVTALQLFVNGKRADRDRAPGCSAPANCRYTPTGLAGGGERFKTLAHPDEVEAVVGVRWRDFHCRIHAINGDAIEMAEPCWQNTIADSKKNGWSNASPKGKPYKGIDWFENAYEFLGTPGQFYIDTRTHTAYYVPRAGEDLATADVELPLAEHLVEIEGSAEVPVHDLVFRNLTFMHAGWLGPDTPDGYVPLQAGYLVEGPHTTLPDNGEGLKRVSAAVETLGGLRISFVHDTFRELGTAGIALASVTRDSNVSDSTFEDISGGAVFVGDTTAPHSGMADLSGGNRISRNYITHVAVQYRDNVGIMGGFNDGLTIDHNTLSELPYTGISVGWGWNYEGEGDTQRNIAIEFNHIDRFMLTLFDGGAIYTQAQSPGSSVVENTIDFASGPHGNGIYLDERSRKYAVCGNVVWNVPNKLKEGRWVSAWSSWSGDLNIHNNWSDDEHLTLHNTGPTKRYIDNQLALKVLPKQADEVLHAAGIDGHGNPIPECAASTIQ